MDVLPERFGVKRFTSHHERTERSVLPTAHGRDERHFIAFMQRGAGVGIRLVDGIQQRARRWHEVGVLHPQVRPHVRDGRAFGYVQIERGRADDITMKREESRRNVHDSAFHGMLGDERVVVTNGAKKLHILHIYKNYAPTVGGIENHIKMLAEGEAARGHTSTVLVVNDAARTVRERINGVHIIRAARVIDFASTPFSVAMAWAGLHEHPRIVNLHMPYPPGDIVARLVPDYPALVLTYHCDVVRQRRLLQVYRPVLERSLASAERIIASSAAYVASSPFLRAWERKCRIVPYGVDGARFGTVEPAAVERIRRGVRGPVILCVGVLRYYKGLHIMLNALRELDATLIIVGEGNQHAALQALAARLGIAERVRFAGRVPDEQLPTYYHAADVFVLPSHLRAEAFGIVLLEAMAAGLPVVSTEIGTATSEVNVHGTTGFVVPPNDAHALAQALRVLLADESLRRRMGEAARERATTEYTPARMVERTLAVYNEAVVAQRKR